MTQSNQAIEHLDPEQLNAFIDGELSADVAQGVQQHLDGCHHCALRVLGAMQMKAATARVGQRYTPSAEALSRLTARLRPQAPEPNEHIVPFRTVSSRHVALWSAVAAAILLTISLAGWQQIHQAHTLTAELLDQHLATLSSGAAPQVISTDRHTVKPWFQGRLPFSFNLPEPDALPPDTALQGADLVYLEGRPAALLIFSIHKHTVSVFVTQRTSAFSIAPHSTRSGFSVRSATAGEIRLIAVSNVNPAELDALVRDFAKVQ
ncbi:MAG TPA: zf-HC2 domain-containing protein [Edaphobacter sp.]|uniref:anti-sigma factor family protein n=1 Tax=Edaphobacter sp. TaxID=1934404 RepID=UPI002D19BAA7|nr:zf-HC2 domain-containing protein [Edaphobacter sp.]HUZ94693.1 zf-HC2 domain-containing protein [Edaphobacter sp.]